MQRYDRDVETTIDTLVQDVLEGFTISGRGYLTPSLFDVYSDIREERVLTVDLLLLILFRGHEAIYNTLSEEESGCIQLSLFHALVGYGDKTRALGHHAYLNHPLLAARVLLRAYEQAGGEDLPILLQDAFYHDLPEERIDYRIKAEKKGLAGETIDEVCSEGEKQLFGAFSALAQETRRGKVPVYEGDISQYEHRLTSLVEDFIRDSSHTEENYALSKKTRKRMERFCAERALDTPELLRAEMRAYLDSIHRYVPLLWQKVMTREKEIIEEEKDRFREELVFVEERLSRHGLRQPATQEIIEDTFTLTRMGSELYYQACSGLHGDSHNLRPLLVKCADRLANTMDTDKSTRDSRIHFFPYHEIISLLDAPRDAERDERVYEVVRQNRQHHQAEDVAEQRRRRLVEQGNFSDPPQRLHAHRRLYGLYKNIILIDSIRRHVEEQPPMLNYLQDWLIKLTMQEARKVVTGVFSNHCQGRQNFTLDDARRIWKELNDYDHRGGFEQVTRQSQHSMFDGLLERYFDQRARGSQAAIEPLLTEKKYLFGAALAVVRLTERYYQNPHFVLEGMGDRELVLGEPIVT